MRKYGIGRAIGYGTQCPGTNDLLNGFGFVVRNSLDRQFSDVAHLGYRRDMSHFPG
jgi:hypothetical protein